MSNANVRQRVGPAQVRYGQVEQHQAASARADVISSLNSSIRGSGGRGGQKGQEKGEGGRVIERLSSSREAGLPADAPMGGRRQTRPGRAQPEKRVSGGTGTRGC
ncbi:MAG: hypothetical protein K2V38_14040 [Gemmataceae bacterium]|nr:hypothetical protein [Gemmataceae bacterium]